jgi:3-mercaptopyruvate sulfurtransferase SseA
LQGGLQAWRDRGYPMTEITVTTTNETLKVEST